MKNSIQISLFLNNKTDYELSELSYELTKQIDDLGDPIFLSENKNFPQDANAPLLLFIKNKDINFISNFYTITITIAGEKIEFVNNYVEKIMNVLDKLKIHAYRVGYVVNMQYDAKNILEFKSKAILSEAVLKSEDFELSWLNFININNKNVNCWHRYYTNKQINDKLNVLYDINTKPEERIDINKDFVLNFLEQSENYINSLNVN